MAVIQGFITGKGGSKFPLSNRLQESKKQDSRVRKKRGPEIDRDFFHKVFGDKNQKRAGPPNLPISYYILRVPKSIFFSTAKGRPTNGVLPTKGYEGILPIICYACIFAKENGTDCNGKKENEELCMESEEYIYI